MAIELIPHQPLDFTYSLNANCENLSNYCLHYELGDNPMFQFENSADGCGFIIKIRSTDGSIEKQIDQNYFSSNGTFVSVTLDFNSLGLEAGCYEVVLYEVCTLYGSNLVTNGNFEYDLSGWTVADRDLILSLAGITYETIEDANDGSITVSASGGTPAYTYSKDGINFQASATFSGLSAGLITFTVKDTIGFLDQITIKMEVAADCNSFTGASAYSIKDYAADNIKNCEAFDFV